MTKATARKQAPQTEEVGNDRMLEVTVSGSYRNYKKEIVDFEGLKGIIPFCGEGEAAMHTQGRYVERWLKEALGEDGKPLYPERPESIRQVFIDDIQETTGKLSFVGKDIKKLNMDEIQDLATAKDLRFIPLPNSGLDKRDYLIRAYVAYADKILNKKVKYQEEKFNFAKLPSITLNGDGRIEDQGKFSNEEIIELEAEGMKKPSELGTRDNPRDRWTIQELRTMADSKNIAYEPDTSLEELYSQLFAA